MKNENEEDLPFGDEHEGAGLRSRGEEALGLYEANWRHVEASALHALPGSGASRRVVS